MKKMTPQEKLLSAVRRNKPYEVEKAIKEGADVNKHGEFEETPLHVAAFFASYKATRVLLKHGADVDADQRHHKTPLRYAVDRLYHDKDDTSFLMTIKTIRELLAAGANEEAFDLELDTPKSEACVFAYMRSYERFKEYMMRVCPQDLVAEVIGLFTADKDLESTRIAWYDEVIMIREQDKVSVFDSDAADIDFAEFKERVSSMSRHPKLKADLEAFKRKYPHFWAKYQQEAKNKR